MTDRIRYRDFDLTIRSDGDGRYVAKVNDSPAGASEPVTLKWPFPDVKPKELLLELENAVLRGLALHRGHEPMLKEEKTLRDFGSGMFKSVFKDAPDIARQFSSSISMLSQEPGKVEGLRIKLRVESPELAGLPWEYVYDEIEEDYLCLQDKSPLVRFLDIPKPASQLAVDGTLNVLGMVANPGGEWPLLDTDKERGRIEEAISSLQPKSRVNFKWVKGGTAEHLLDMMQEEPWHVFHFIGHGGTEEAVDGPNTTTPGVKRSRGYIVLENGHGGGDKISASDLRLLLQGELRLAVLNCCESARSTGNNLFSSLGASLVRSVVPMVVAMQFPISDQAGIQFARQFYKSLLAGDPVEKAITLARIGMRFSSSLEWGIPVLFARSAKGTLFSVERPGPGAELGGDETPPPRRSTAQDELRKLFN